MMTLAWKWLHFGFSFAKTSQKVHLKDAIVVASGALDIIFFGKNLAIIEL